MIEPGAVVGHYVIRERIGSGGMGVVYRAEDLTLGRQVAIKFLPHGVADAEALARFWREARALSALNHPHICTVHEFGDHEGQPYLVMELLHAPTRFRFSKRRSRWMAILPRPMQGWPSPTPLARAG